MERKFCGKCGKPIGECSCGATAVHSTGFGSSKADWEETNRDGSYYIKRLDKIALIQGETVVRQYHIGEFAKGLGPAGKGSASIIITNKRVISKQDSDYFGSSSISVEEISLDSVAGVKNYYFQGYTIWRLLLAISFGLVGISTTFSAFGGWSGFSFLQFIIGLIFCGFAVYMGCLLYTSPSPRD